MAKRKSTATTTIRLDGEREFKEALSRINQGLRENASGLKLAQARYKENGESVEELAKVQAILEKRIRLQSEAVDEYRKMLDQAGKATEKDQKRISQLRIGYNEARTTLSKMSAALKENRTAMEKAGTATEDLSDEMKDVKDAGETAKKGSDVFNISLGNLISDGIQKAIAAIGDLLEKTAEYRADMSKLEQNTRDAGVSLDLVQDSMRSLNAITGETDSNIEAVSNLLAAGFQDNNLQAAIDTLSGAVIKFPDTIKIESLADSLQETLATKEATGQFAETLERVGIDVDWYNKRIAKMSDTQARNFSISVLQQKGLAETTKEWRENNEQLIKAADAQYNLNDTMAQFAEKIEPIVAKGMEELIRFLGDHEEEITRFIDAWATIANVVLPLAVEAFDLLAGALMPVLTVLNDILKAAEKVKNMMPSVGAKIKDSLAGVMDFVTGAGAMNALTTASVPHYAKGTSNHPGGLATINDGGGYPGETVLLPRGARVYPATQGGSGNTYNYYVTIDAKNVREFNDVIRIAENQRQSRRMGYVRQP